MTRFNAAWFKSLRSRRRRLAPLLLLLPMSALAIADSARFDIPAQPLPAALKTFADQSKIQLLYRHDAVKGATGNSVVGDFDTREALQMLLEGTGLEVVYSKDNAATIRPLQTASKPTAAVPRANEYTRLAQAESAPAAPTPTESVKRVELEEVVVTIPEVLVVGSKILNMDIRRSEDDPQPYVIFDRAVLEKSGANNVEDFLKQRLPMNVQGRTNSQGAGLLGNTSSINLRGLGANQTLILIDGHRTANPSPSVTGTVLQQTDINGIPLAAVERIEILPTTASGIYGGGATGGVVNIVLRRDYSGIETKLTYENTFDTDMAQRRVDMSAGFSIEGGRTQILMAGSYSDANELVLADRDFYQRGRATILRNNPSALLGAATPPLGATPNIRSVNGSPLFGPGTPNYTSVPAGYAGGGGLAPFQANAGQYSLELADTRQSDGGGRRALLNAPTIESLMATLRREFSPSVQAFLELAGSNNTGYFPTAGVTSGFTVAANAPSNPFGQAVRVTFPHAAQEVATNSESYDRRVVGGVIVKLPKAWTGELDYTWNRNRVYYSQPSFAGGAALSAAISNGTLDVLRDTIAFPLDLTPYIPPLLTVDPFKTTFKNAAVRVAGPIGSLPAGAPQLSILVEHRNDIFHESREYLQTGERVYPERSQSVDSLYLEARVPLVSARNRMSGVRELELQVAGRYDDYTVKGVTNSLQVGSTDQETRATNQTSSINPTFGVRYRPLEDVTLRASYGTGFLPPSVQQIVPNPPFNQSVSGLMDPKRGSTPVPPVSTSPFGGVVPTILGGSPDLRPEESKSWSAGLILTPRVVPGLRLSVDYTRIEKTDNVVLLSAQQVIDNEDLLTGRVTRGANLPGDLPGWPGPIVQLDQTVVNIANAEVEAFDLALDYSREMRFGTFDFFAVGTRQTHYKTQLTPSAPIVENVSIGNSNTSPLALAFKGNAGITWGYGGWEIGWMTRYFHSYRLGNPTQALNQGNGGRVPSQVYHDFVGTYRLNTSNSWLDGTEVQVGVKNVLDKRPPFDASFTSYYYSPYGDPRLASYYISLKKSF